MYKKNLFTTQNATGRFYIYSYVTKFTDENLIVTLTNNLTTKTSDINFDFNLLMLEKNVIESESIPYEVTDLYILSAVVDNIKTNEF